MIHPFFKLMVAHPTAITDHVEAYASLAAQELSVVVTQYQQRAIKTGIALCCGGAAVVLAGVSVMLWAVTPPDALHAPWALWLVPGLPALIAGWCAVSARNSPAAPAFGALRGQVRDDMALLREVSA